MEAHQAADLFPLMSDDELQALADDIAANGLNQPIVTYEGRILDGRNRARACEMAGVEIETIEWDDPGCGPVAWVVSQNIRRRHLTATQRSALAVDLLPELEAEAKERQAHGSTAPGKALVEKVPQASQPKARDRAAELVQVNERYVSDAKKIAAQSPELLSQMRAGEISLRDAQREVKKVAQERESSDPSKWTEREVQLRDRMESGEAVVVNLRDDTRLVAWADGRGWLVRVDRTSEWGNPFYLNADGSRDEVCDAYADHYLPHKPSLGIQISSLRGKALGCWCAPERCHADELARRANET